MVSIPEGNTAVTYPNNIERLKKLSKRSKNMRKKIKQEFNMRGNKFQQIWIKINRRIKEKMLTYIIVLKFEPDFHLP